MVVPLKDINPSRTFPITTVILIALNVAMFLYQLSLGSGLDHFVRQAAFIPAQYFIPGNFVDDSRSILTSMFMHGGFLHLGGNMLYLWIFGDNVEDRIGHLTYLAFYLFAGWGASLAHGFADPNSLIPTVGASGAIAGVLGAYLVMYPKARVLTLVPMGLFTRVTQLPAVLVLALWFVLQIFSGVASIGRTGGGVAWWAHIGGFVIGLVLGALLPLLRRDLGPRPPRFEL